MKHLMYYDFKVKKDLIFTFMQINNLNIFQFCSKAGIDVKVFIGLIMLECGCEIDELDKIASFMHLDKFDILEDYYKLSLCICRNEHEKAILDSKITKEKIKNYKRNRKKYRKFNIYMLDEYIKNNL